MIQTLNFESEILNETRDIFVYLPQDYSNEFENGYPVLYMMDGQNIFSKDETGSYSWDLDITADRLIRQGIIEPLVIVGVAHGLDRDAEYTPTFDPDEKSGGYADTYLEFLIQELMPQVNSEFNVTEETYDTAICGSSLGGLLAIYAMLEHNDVFGKVGAVSPSLWWDDRVIFEMAEHWKSEYPFPVLWLDMGLNEVDGPGEENEVENMDLNDTYVSEFIETDPVEDAREFRDLLEKIGFQEGEEFAYFEDAWGFHDEMSWGVRMDKIMEFLFGKWRLKDFLK